MITCGQKSSLTKITLTLLRHWKKVEILKPVATSYERKLGLAGEDNEKQLEAHKEFLEGKKALDDNYAGTVVDDGKNLSDKKEKIVKSEVKDIEKATDSKIDNEAAYMNAATSIGQAVFADNKAVSAGLAVANTATGYNVK